MRPDAGARGVRGVPAVQVINGDHRQILGVEILVAVRVRQQSLRFIDHRFDGSCQSFGVSARDVPGQVRCEAVQLGWGELDLPEEMLGCGVVFVGQMGLTIEDGVGLTGRGGRVACCQALRRTNTLLGAVEACSKG